MMGICKCMHVKYSFNCIVSRGTWCTDEDCAIIIRVNPHGQEIYIYCLALDPIVL
jgi:hypothetical protein